MNFTGRPRSRTTDTTNPPRAVPSSLVMTRPLTPTYFRHAVACSTALRPKLPSTTNYIYSITCIYIYILVSVPHTCVRVIESESYQCFMRRFGYDVSDGLLHPLQLHSKLKVIRQASTSIDYNYIISFIFRTLYTS